LPRSVLARPHHPVLRRAADAVQFGMLAEGAVEAAELTGPLLRLLLELRGERRIDELLARAAELGADRAAAHALLADLYAAGALIDAGLHARVHEARRSACVLVSGDGPLPVEVANGLAAAGVGVLTGSAETEEAARRGAPPGTTSARAQPDLVVLAGPLWPGPEAGAPGDPGVPRLVARVTDGVGLVGPLVLPRRSACLRCGDLHRAARDPRWATVAADLAGRVGSASHATTTATAALAVEQAVLVLDSLVASGRPPPTLNAVLELDPRGGELRRRPWPPHPRCGCGAARALSGGADLTPVDGGRPGQTGRASPEARVTCGEEVRR
jgi:bacteriocin biosynthesis cyclodehydratase domain-containing protein